MKKLGIPQGVSRISFSIFNTFEEIDNITEALKKIQKRFE